MCPSTYQLLWNSCGDSGHDLSFDKSTSLECLFSSVCVSLAKASLARFIFRMFWANYTSSGIQKTFIGSGVGTGSVHVLQGVEFEVEPQEDLAFEVEPLRNVVTVAGNAVTSSMANTESIHQATKGLLDKAREMYLVWRSLEIRVTDVHVFVDFDYAMGRSITVMGRSITRYGLMIQGCAGS
nr:zinc finger, CCHC-type [Tanacetum cinerariifolium]